MFGENNNKKKNRTQWQITWIRLNAIVLFQKMSSNVTGESDDAVKSQVIHILLFIYFFSAVVSNVVEY